MKPWFRYFTLFLFSFYLLTDSYGQETQITGTVTDQLNQPLFGASVALPDLNLGTVTDDNGQFTLRVDIKGEYQIVCSYVGYQAIVDTVEFIPNKTTVLNFSIQETTKLLDDVVVTGTQKRDITLTRVNMKAIDQIPSASGNIETLIKTMTGVVSGNELSSQYSVRGGNFDENLIYVDDIEIYRPFLVQSATQEGLSFVNPNMVSSIQFSAGGFEAEYGDKMASVLDVKYKKPTEFEGTVIASLLGGSVHLAGTNKTNKLYANAGFRYKTTNYLLNSLDVQGEYVPKFADLQALIGYNITEKSSLTILGNYSTNRFSLIPESRYTKFGSIARTLNMYVDYMGQEQDRFDSYMGAVSYNYTPNDNLTLKFIGSIFDTDEEVNFDILSEYSLSESSRLSSGKDTTINIGTGQSLKHARNSLNANVYSAEHKGFYFNNDMSWKWGVRAQYEHVDDYLSEWQLLDSAGMSVPYSDEFIHLDYAYKAHNIVSSYRYQAFLQNSNKFYVNGAEWGYNLGLRMNYWDLNKELLLSPRASLSFYPNWDKRVHFYLSTGLYSQPPFYKELTSYNGEFYPETKAQKSFQVVLGSDLHYRAWGRPFIFSTEIYYKNFYRLIPYKVENVQVHYMPWYRARGYAKGIDFRINGEFVPGVESWFSISLLQTREDTYNDSYQNINGEVVYPGYYRRPSDQTLTFSIFFQDYLPFNPHYKVHLLVNYGSGLPYSGPNQDQPSQYYMLSQYRRVDIGFSRNIKRTKNKKVGLNDIWITLEILNLLDARNMASYDWVRTVENNQGYQDSFAIPNFLTQRRVNLKISTRL